MPQVWRFDATKFINGGSVYSVVNSQFGILLCKSDGGSITIVLPPLRNSKMWGQDDSWILVHDYGNNASINNITIVAGAGDTINAEQTFTISANGGSVLLIPSQLFTWSVIGGGSGGNGSPCRLVQVTVAQLRALVSVNGLNICWTYEITDSSTDFNTGNHLLRRLRLVANSTNTFSEVAQGEYYYPDYQLGGEGAIGILNQWLPETGRVALELPPIVAGDVYIYFGYRFRNITGVNTDTNPLDDTTNWLLLSPSVANGYITHWNQVTYDLDIDLVIWRREQIVNSNIAQPSIINGKACDNQVTISPYFFSIQGINSINLFQWGTSTGCTVSGALININNIISCDNSDVYELALVAVREAGLLIGCNADDTAFLSSGGDVSAPEIYARYCFELRLEGEYANGISASWSVFKFVALSADIASGGGSANLSGSIFSNCDLSLGYVNMRDSTVQGVLSGSFIDTGSTVISSLMAGVKWGLADLIVMITLDTNIVIMTGSIMESFTRFTKNDFPPNGSDGQMSSSFSTLMANTRLTMFGQGSWFAARIGKNQQPIMLLMTESGSGMNIIGAILEGHKISNAFDFIFFEDNGSTTTERFDRTRSIYVLDDLTLSGQTAFSLLTTYGFGDTAENGADLYMYINKYYTAGNPLSNPAYWFKVYDFMSEVVTIPQELGYIGEYPVGAASTPVVISAFIINSSEESINFEYAMFSYGSTTTTILSAKNGGFVLTSPANLVMQPNYARTIFYRGATENIEKNRLIYV